MQAVCDDLIDCSLSSCATILDCLVLNGTSQADEEFARFVSPEDTVETLTYGQLLTRTRQYASCLARLGVSEGTVVPLILASSLDIYPLYLAVMAIGALPAMFPPLSKRQNPAVFWPMMQKVLHQIAPDTICSDKVNAALMKDALPEFADRVVVAEPIEVAADFARRRESDPALLQYSSGTTGLKKGVVLPHEAILRQCRSYAASIQFSPADKVASWLPLYHDMGLITSFLLPLTIGASITVMDPFVWAVRPLTLLDMLERDRATFTWLPNFAFNHILRSAPAHSKFDLGHVRAWINCSEPCKAETFDAFLSRFASSGVCASHLQVCYAMAENVFAVTQTRLGEVVPRRATATGERLSCGTPIAGARIRIASGQDSGMPGDETVGEIAISGESLFSGYWQRDAASSNIVENEYFSRDLGFIDSSGELFITGRKDDLIIVHGKNLYAHDIENAICSDSGVKPGRCIALGVFDDDVGSQDLVIVAEMEPSASDEDRRQLVREVSASVEREVNLSPKRVSLVQPGWLIKTTSGKISRNQNLAKYLGSLHDNL